MEYYFNQLYDYELNYLPNSVKYLKLNFTYA